MFSTSVLPRSLQPRHTKSDPAPLAASQLPSQVQTLPSNPHHLRRRHIWQKPYSQSAPADHVLDSVHRPHISLMDYSLPRLCTTFSERAFSHAGPAIWNALPDNIRTVADPVTFRKLLKSHYFSVVFNIY